jgi:hypothetical protein
MIGQFPGSSGIAIGDRLNLGFLTIDINVFTRCGTANLRAAARDG